ncbi:hypothetical protein N9L18_00035 [Candidatus Pacebacteria bacterium]|nr:hypothetical protein [Candidatus Paceibacterota bacterium]
MFITIRESILALLEDKTRKPDPEFIDFCKELAEKLDAESEPFTDRTLLVSWFFSSREMSENLVMEVIQRIIPSPRSFAVSKKVISTRGFPVSLICTKDGEKIEIILSYEGRNVLLVLRTPLSQQ